MPSSATITSFFTFVAGTRARASQVNTNFDVFRGHLIPVNTDTATASHQTHDLGSPDHQWRRIYLKEPPIVGGESAKLEIQAVVDGSLPTDVLPETKSWLNEIAFPKGRTTGVVFQFVVPPEYVVGNRISLSLRGYCETATSHIVLESAAALYKASITSMALTAPTNVLTSTSNVQPAIANTAFTNTSLRLTDASGLINSLTVTAGDVLSCYLKRTGAATGDTNTGYFFLTNLLVDLNN